MVATGIMIANQTASVDDGVCRAWKADESERAVLGACMIQDGIVTALSNKLSRRDFREPAYGRLFEFFQGMDTLGEPTTDSTLVVSKLAKTTLLAEVGGIAGLARLCTDCGYAPDAILYAAQVREAADRRRLSDMFADFYERLKDPRIKPADSISALMAEVAVIGMSSDVPAITIAQAAKKTVDRIRRSRESKYSVGVQTGLYAIDSVTGGLFPEELVLLAARPGIGKSALAAQIADHAASQGRPSLFISMEMAEWEIAGRWLSTHLDVDSRSIRAGRVDDETIEQMEIAIGQNEDLPSWIWRPRKPTVAKIRAKCKEIAIQHGLALVVVDYIQLIQGENARDFERDRLSQIGKDLKDLASELQVPVLALSQLNRGAEDGRPSLNMLSGSGRLEQDANAVWMLHRPRDSNDTVLMVEKNRGGQIGDVPLVFDGEKTMYRDGSSGTEFV